MKAVTFFRHAKSERERHGSGDFDRPLTERGREDCGRIGTIIPFMLPPPQIFLTSPARRAKETAVLLSEAAAKSRAMPIPSPEEHDALYLADEDTVWDFCHSALMEADEVWICGHNPGISEALAMLSGLALYDIPTLGTARVVFSELSPSPPVGKLVFYDTPRNHRGHP